MKFTNLGSNVIILLLLSALAWGGIFALFAVWLIGAPSFVGWTIVCVFLSGMLLCVSLMGLEIFRPSDTHKKQAVAKKQPLERPPEVPAQELDDFPQAALASLPAVRPPSPLQVALPTLAPLQQHAFGGMLIRPMQPPANLSPAAPPITQSIHPQESAVSSGHSLGK